MLTQRQKNDNSHFPYSDYLVSTTHEFVFCAIPKNACTPLKRWFLSVVEPDLPPGVDVHAHCRDYYGLHLVPAPRIREVLDNYFCFTVVRDPLKRIASAFANKFVETPPHQLFEPAREVVEEIHRMYGAVVPYDAKTKVDLEGRFVEVPTCSTVPYRRGITFREFVKYLCAAPDEHMDIHWRPQTRFLEHGRRWTMGSMDNFVPFVRSIAERLRVPAPAEAQRKPAADLDGGGLRLGDVLSSELNRRLIYPAAAALYDQDTTAAIRDRYREDVELFESVQAGAVELDAGHAPRHVHG